VSDIAISVEQLSKSYWIGHRAPPGRITFRENLSAKAGSLLRGLASFGRANGKEPPRSEEFWALRDVSLEVRRGEVLGIIGRNGAGKSTLLKVLSRITEPTRGRILLHGRVGSLLEVGTGFHPELTGRENIFLNGAILGMSHAEIRRKFDEIVDFAGVARFLDTPVKRYSSGMYVRLAFAVAAHLEPEILIVDEVLAVGDAEFQKKCLGKMHDVASGGRTVLFVSHNLSAVAQLTQRALILDAGSCRYLGPTEQALERYANAHSSDHAVDFDVSRTPRKGYGTGIARITRLRFERAMPVFGHGEDFGFVATVHALEDIPRLRFSMTLFALDNTPVGSCFGSDDLSLAAGQVADIRVSLPDARLAPGKYYCGLSIGRGDYRTGHVDFDVVLDTLQFEVRPEEGAGGTVSCWVRSWGPTVLPAIRQSLAEVHA
jgi:lipopolysaccharide transport system ATP-binding protein